MAPDKRIRVRKAKDGTPRYQARWTSSSGMPMSKTFTKKRDAEDWLSNIRAAVKRGEDELPEVYAPMVAELRERVLKDRRYAGNTLAIQLSAWNHVPESLRSTKVTAVTRSDVNRVLEAVKAPEMRAKVRAVLSVCFKLAMEDEIIRENPARSLKRITTREEREEDKPKHRILSKSEVKALIEETPDRYKVLIETLARVGLRPDEALGMTRGQVRLGIHPELVIDRTLIGGLTKTGERRTVPIPGDLAGKLEAHMDEFTAPGDDALVFTKDGNAIDRRTLGRREFLPAATAAGLVPPRLRLYDLRHTACSNALALGIDPVTVANMSGHDVGMLLSTYAHPVKDATRAAADRLGREWKTEEVAAKVLPIVAGE
jgi:integrase